VLKYSDLTITPKKQGRSLKYMFLLPVRCHFEETTLNMSKNTWPELIGMVTVIPFLTN